MKPEVSIVTLNWNGREFLEGFFDSIRKQDFPKNEIEVLMVDNGSTDSSVEFVEKKFPFVKIVKLEKNFGFSEGCNVAYARAAADLVFVIGNDSILPRDLVSNMVSEIKDLGVGMLAADDYPVGGDLSKFKPLDTINIICGNAAGAVSRKGAETVPRCAAFIVDKKIVGKKLFDGDYFAYGEDVWLCFRLLLQEKKVKYSENCRIWHFGAGTGSRVPTISFFTERNRLLNIFTFLKFSTIMRILPIMVFDFFVKFFSFTFKLNFKRLSNFLKAYGWIFLNFGVVLKKRNERQMERKIGDDVIVSKMSCKLYGYQRGRHKFLAGLLDKTILLYCRLVGLNIYELQKGA